MININKIKMMTIKFKKIFYYVILYANNIFEEIKTYNYLGSDFKFHLSWSHNVKKKIICGWKYYYALENKCRNV
jgi:hypothetical protein